MNQNNSSQWSNSSNKKFIIATANLLNFTNPNRTFYENTPPYDETSFQKKLSGLTRLLSPVHADILAVQEVWDSEALTKLGINLGFTSDQVISPLASNDRQSPFTKGLGAQKTPAVGILTRFPVLEQTLLTEVIKEAVIEVPDVGLYQSFMRPPLLLRLDVLGLPITVITAHLKSKRAYFLHDDQGAPLEDLNDPNIRVRAKLRSLCMRAAEAASIRMAIINRLQHTREPLILLGDMNDVTNSVTTQLMSETSEVNYDKSLRDVALFDAALIQARVDAMKEVAYSHIYQGIPEIIDQLMVSEEFLSTSKFAKGQIDQVDYFNDHLKWDITDRVTDHGIIRAKIKLYES